MPALIQMRYRIHFHRRSLVTYEIRNWIFYVKMWERKLIPADFSIYHLKSCQTLFQGRVG